MVWLGLALALLIILFGFVLLFGAPYLPTMKRQTEAALDLLNLKSGHLLIELGSGDGRVQRAAAKRGIKSIGYELNPLLVLYSKVRNWRYRGLSKTYWRNFWHANLAGADGIYVFLLKPYMPKLDKKITREIAHQTRIVSYAFALPGRKPSKTKAGLMLYEFLPGAKKREQP